MATKYKNPPINELIIGVYFEPPLAQLQAEHIGLFWSQLRNEFPTIRQQAEIAVPIATQGFQINLEAYPMPRYWLIAEDETTLVQIQKNAFLLNWRKGRKEYPHFDEVKAHFDRLLSAFEVFLKDELGIDRLPMRIAELTYTNLIPEGDIWKGPSEIRAILPGITVPSLGRPTLQEPDFNYVTAYQLEPDLGLNFVVRNAHQFMDASKRALIFEFRTVGVLASPDRKTADEWYRRAHDTIGECFTAVTSNDIRQSVWQPE